MRYFLLLCLFLGFSNLGTTQDSNLGNWIIYFGNKKIDAKWNWHHEVQYRNYNAIGDLEQLLLRTGIGYNLSEKNNNLLLGYGYILSGNYDDTGEKNSVSEHRIYQQFITKQAFGRVNLQHRYRLEERFVEDDFKVRFRYFLALTVALNQEKMGEDTFYLSAYNELFVNGSNNYFDRNRVYAGIGYRLSPLIRFEVGYMNQIFSVGGRDQLNIITALNF